MDTSTEIIFAPLLSWALIASLAGAGAMAVLYAAWRRARGTGLRALAIATLLALLANPSIKQERREPLPDIAVVVVDESPSQGIGSRRMQTEAALDHIRARLAKDKTSELRVVRAGKPKPITQAAAGAETKIPRDRGTRLFEALARVMGDIPPQRFAGAVLITDGQIHDAPKEASNLPFQGPLHGLLTGTRNLRDRRLVVEQATIEAESMGHRTGAKGVEKRDFALTLSATRLNSLTRPSPERLEELVEKAVPGARRSVPPPKVDSDRPG